MVSSSTPSSLYSSKVCIARAIEKIPSPAVISLLPSLVSYLNLAPLGSFKTSPQSLRTTFCGVPACGLS